MDKVTIVIPNYNGAAFLEQCLDALRAQTVTEQEIIVVDNCSKDSSIEMIEQQYPEVELVKLDKNYGFSRAVNEGIKRANAKYVLLLNNDTKAAPDFLEMMLKAIKDNPTAFSVCPKMIQYHDPARLDDAGDFYCALGWAYARGKDKPASRFDKKGSVFAACAGASIYRKEIMQKIGLFDEAHFAYLEDIDIGYRARIHGYQNYYEPKAVVHHIGSGTSGSRHNAFKVKLTAGNTILLIYKNMPFLQILLNLPFLLIGILIKFLYFIKKGLGKTYIQGIGKGFRSLKKAKKVKYNWRNLRYYVRIQFELWFNMVRILWK